MTFTKKLREGIRRGRIRCTVRVWTRPHVKVGGRYRMDDGHVVVDAISPIEIADITYDLGFDTRSIALESRFTRLRDSRIDLPVFLENRPVPTFHWHPCRTNLPIEART